MKKIMLSMAIATVAILCTLLGLFAVPIYYILNYLSKLYNNKAGIEGRKELEEKE